MATLKKLPTVQVDYDVASRRYIVIFTVNGTICVKYFDESTFEEIHDVEVKRELEQTKEKLESMKKDMAEQLNKLSKAFEEKLEHERRLRAEVEKRNEHLQDEVSRKERDLQRRNEPYSIPAIGDGYVIVSDGTGTSWEPLPIDEGGTSTTAVPSRWAYSGSGWVTKKNDAL